MTKTLICLGGGLEGLPILQRAKALGHRLVVVDGRADAPGMALADVPVVASCYDPAATVAALVKVDEPLNGIICAAVDAPHVAAAVAEYAGLPGLTPAQAALSVDKLAQKRALRGRGLPVPDFVSLRGDDYGDSMRGAYIAWGAIWDGKPAVIKPNDSRGARGVSMVYTEADIESGFREALRHSRSGLCTMEEYLPGPQLSTESIVVDGRVLFTAIALRNYDRLAEFAPHIIEDGFDMPYGDAALQADVDDVLTRACAALGWRTLTVKADLIIHEGRVVILELAARLSGGFLSTHGTPRAYGVDLIGAAIRLALGESLDTYMTLPTMTGRWVAQRYIFPDAADIGRTAAEVPELKQFDDACMLGGPPWDGRNLASGGVLLPGVAFATYAVRPGDVIAPVVSHSERLGQAIATGATPELARALAEAAVEAMKRAVTLE